MLKQKLLLLIHLDHFRTKLRQNRVNDTLDSAGFSLIEVLVMILVISGFFLGSLQATVLATMLRMQAQDKQEAANLVQQDLELLRYQAFILDYNTTTSVYTPDAASCTAATYGTRFRDTRVLNTAVQPNFPASQTLSIQGRNYAVTRTYTPAGNNLQVAYNVSYASNHPRYRSGGNNQITSLTTEVLPNVVLSCS